MKNILLLYDGFLVEHNKFTSSVIKVLGEIETLESIELDSYLKEKLQLLSFCRYDYKRRKTRASRRLIAVGVTKKILKNILLPFHVTKHKNNVNSYRRILGPQRVAYLRSMVSTMSVHELLVLEWCGVHIGKHACVDLSLDCKCTGEDIVSHTPQHLILRSLCFHAILLLEVLERMLQTNASGTLRFISTSVYSLDWIAREFVHCHQAQHRFLIPLKLDPPVCRIYKTYCDDLLRLRKEQSDMIMTSALLSESCDSASSYLEHRLNPRTVHRYSPLSSNPVLLSQILSRLNKLDKIWTYYTNSPDELVSVNHGYYASEISQSEMPWYNDSFVTSEEQCLWVLSELAFACDAVLVIRHHPRLQPEQRSQFQSSSFHSLSLVCNRIRELYPNNIIIIHPNDRINSYELALASDRVISFRGTMPLETSLMGLRPIVMAKDQGAMNYWILLHAEAAPKDKEDLLHQLTVADEQYSPHELARFLCEFFLLQVGGSIPLEAQSSKALLHEALITGSSRGIAASSSSNDHEVGSEDLSSIIERYMTNVQHIVSGAFFMNDE